jgi:hypothetical protein
LTIRRLMIRLEWCERIAESLAESWRKLALRRVKVILARLPKRTKDPLQRIGLVLNLQADGKMLVPNRLN